MNTWNSEIRYYITYKKSLNMNIRKYVNIQYGIFKIGYGLNKESRKWTGAHAVRKWFSFSDPVYWIRIFLGSWIRIRTKVNFQELKRLACSQWKGGIRIHTEVKRGIRIHFEVKRGIRIRIKVMRIRNPGVNILYKWCNCRLRMWNLQYSMYEWAGFYTVLTFFNNLRTGWNTSHLLYPLV